MPGPDKHKPCKDCPDRTDLGLCHSTCEAYREIQEENRKKREYLAKENQTAHMFPATMKYKKSSGCYVVPKGAIRHKKGR